MSQKEINKKPEPKGSEWDPAPRFPNWKLTRRTLLLLVGALFLSVALGAIAVSYLLHHMFDR